MTRLRALAYAWLPVVLWMALILGLSSQSTLPKKNDPITGEPIPSMYPVAKAWHVAEYLVLSLLVYRGLRSSAGSPGVRPLRAAAIALAVSVGFGALDEFRQSFVPKREASPLDVAIDGAGAMIGLGLLFAWRRIRGPASRRAAEVETPSPDRYARSGP